MLRTICAALALAVATAASAATIAVTPATFAVAVKAAQPGDTIRLAPGSYGDFGIGGAVRSFDPPIVLDACAADGQTNGGATFRSLAFTNWSGITLNCFHTTPGANAGLALRNASRVTINYFVADGPVRAGIEALNADHLTASHARVNGSGSDGVHFADVSDVLVDALICEHGKPTPLSHADCGQFVGSQAYPLRNVTVRFSIAIGPTAGFDLFGNLATPTGIHFEHNSVRTTYSQGTTWRNQFPCLPDGGCTFRFNSVAMLPGAPHTVQIWPQTMADVPGWPAGSVTGNSANATKP